MPSTLCIVYSMRSRAVFLFTVEVLYELLMSLLYEKVLVSVSSMVRGMILFYSENQSISQFFSDLFF